jgi:hypothetical protein
MRPHQRWSSVTFVIVALVLGACPQPGVVSTFGLPCSASVECDGAQMCRPDPLDGTPRCLPPRQQNEAGESCAAPLVLGVVGGPDDVTILDRDVTFGAAIDDVDTACGAVDAADVVLRFTLTPRAGDDATVPQGIAIQAPEGAAVELRRAGCDGEVIRFGCAAAGAQALVAEVMPGDYDLVVDGAPPAIGTTQEASSRVRVSRIDCPTGALPFDETRCLRSTRLTPMLSRRVHHTAHALDDGGILVAGGSSGEAEQLGTLELYNPVLGRWEYGSLGAGRQRHGSVIIDDDLIAIGGLSISQSRPSFSQVSFRRLAVPKSHARFTSTLAGFGGVEANTRVLAVSGERGRMLVLSSSWSETGIYPLTGRIARSCTNDFTCGDGEACLAEVDGGGRCVCVTSDCDAPRALVRELVSGVLRYEDGVAMVHVGDDLALVAGLPDLPLALVNFANDAIVQPIEASLQRFAALVPIDGRRTWVVGGEDVDGAAVDWIVEVDVGAGTATRRSFSLPRPVARPRAGLLGDHVAVVDDSDLPIVIDLAGVSRPTPIIPARTDSRLISFGDHVVILGGEDDDGSPTSTAQALELVSRRAGPPPVEPLCLATPVPDDGVISGNTLLADDSFQTSRCSGVFLTSFARDVLFTFSVQEPSSVRVINLEIEDEPEGANYGFRLIRGDCRAGEEVACGDTRDRELAMFVPEIPPGDYTLVVEYVGFTDIFDDDAPYGGSPFEARVLLGPPQSCPSDERDPLDDTVSGATLMAAEASFAEFSGRLCPGDVDTFLLEHHAGDFSSIGVGAYPGEVQLERVIIDEDASAAAGRPVVAATTGSKVDELDDAPPGYYLLSLSSEEDAVDFVQWQVSYAPGCVTNPGDSLIPALDDRTPGRAPTLTPGLEVRRSFCLRSDVDVIMLQPGEGFGSSVTVEDGEDVDIAVFRLQDGALGDVHPFSLEPLGFGDVRVDLGDIDEPVALRLSVPASSPEAPELEVDVIYSQEQLGDACESALPLVEAGEREGFRSFDLITFSDDHSPNDRCSGNGCCISYGAPGKDVALSVTLAAGDTLEASLTGANEADVVLYLLEACPSATATNVCVVGRDAEGREETPETLRYTHVGPGPAVYTLILDSYYGEDWAGELRWSVTP